jgi:hypothetical protein
MIPAAKGLFKANRLMPKALAWGAPQRRLREAELRDSSWSECGDSLANVSGLPTYPGELTVTEPGLRQTA